ncbi:GMC family oxidoreductase N-terminal domain-containing protein [Paracoccus sp. DMF-8]|uniref:GMC family oxidoreductase N-terminal domain-containing protein n=1 Tax=Paracoccus sp. DMF-8 TaxID=3019445 RepID=UPI0023E79C09|nr:GMC family oxidoreductase N-terminal domain-containing protein [Paracoccus sp. DMF-8]MDF3605867.1 GMC family oxidoreductase N-terminal domain-containing protein [Paracoccus sp. DMF-8]
MALYYDQAEKIFRIHGDDSAYPAAPRNALPLRPDPVRAHRCPSGRTFRHAGPRAINAAACGTCDGFACKLGQKNDAETCGLEPALATGNVGLVTHATARRLILSADGGQIEAVEREVKTYSAPVLSSNAVNSAALLLHSACDAATGRGGQPLRRGRAPLQGAVTRAWKSFLNLSNT